MPVHCMPCTALQLFSCRAKSATDTSAAEADTVYCSEASCNAYTGNAV